MSVLQDLTPCPGDATEWSVAFHADMMTGGALNISQENVQYLHDLKKVTCKFFANKFNILADQMEFTLAIHRYMLYLGSLVKGDFMCVNQTHHEKVKVFDTEPLMREHWKECHGIQVEEIIMPMLVPDMLKEPGMNRLNVQGLSGTQSSTPGPSGPQGGVPGPSGVTPARPGTDPGLARRTQKLNRQEVKRIAKEEKRLGLEREGKPVEAPEAPSDP